MVSLGLALCIAFGTTAQADCHTDGIDVGGAYTDVGQGTSSQFMSWNKTSREVKVYSTASSGMSTEVCLDAIVDWMTVSGHYDNRTSRNCDPGSSRSGIRYEDSGWAGRTITGLQKAAGCRYVPGPSYENCMYVPASESGCPISSASFWYEKGHAVWLRRENGDVEYNNGGNEASPSD